MADDQATFTYIKSDATPRIARGSMQGIRTPLFRSPSGYVIRYYDLGVKGTRSFHISRLV